MNYDLFVDESCHLEHDKISVMCIGYIKVPRMAYDELKQRFSNVKNKHGIENEIKWSKYSKARLPLYTDSS